MSLTGYVAEHVFKPLGKMAGLVPKGDLTAVEKRVATLVEENAKLAGTLGKDVYKPAARVPENPVKKALNEGKPVYGAFISTSDPAATEMMAASGFDYIFIDAEHSGLGPETVANHIRAAKAEGAVPIVRVPINDVDAIKPFIDLGPGGIIVPNIRTVEDAQKAVAAAKYPPEGNRRVGLGRASGYSRDMGEYLQKANDNVAVILMAEHKDMVSNIDAILSQVKGIDALTLGPQDLAASMGLLGQPGHPEVKAAIAKFEEAAARHGVPMGSSVPDKATATKLQEKGYRFFTGPSDIEAIIGAGNRFMG